MKVLVCGGRDYHDFDAAFHALDTLHGRRPVTTVIHGAAQGADNLAGRWAEARGIACQKFPADWETHGKAAGHIRNRKMLYEHPDLVVAFPGGRGTANMVKQAEQQGVPVWTPFSRKDKR